MPKAPRTADVARRLVDAYVTGLRQHLPTYCIRQLDKLPGAQEYQITRLRQFYPGTPTELLYFLQRVNGTCWESLVAPPGPTPASTTTTASGGASVTASGGSTSAPAAAAATTHTSSSSNASAESMRAAKTIAAATAAKAKASSKATATAAAIASEATAFIKSTLAKKVAGNATRPRRLPHYVALPILGSTYSSCTYYLKSVEQMLLAEQQFPPPSANLPDEGEGWAPPASAASTPTATTAPATAENSAAAAAVPMEGGLSDAAVAAAGVQLNKNTIASVFADHRIVYGAPPSLEEKMAPPTTTPASTAGAAARAQTEEKVVYVDPRIDINASFYHWLVFADSVQPHVRGPLPKILDADLAKVAATAAAAAAKTAAAPVKVFAPSRLYIDFKPVELQGGVYGQVLQFVHGQPSSFKVIASDFGSYLKYLMREEYEFTEELEEDEEEEEAAGKADLVTPKSINTSASKAKSSASTKP
ncbi:hypothetical protein ABL78_7909 [Leptomonas seymouri]|uniref:Knr4/Smi1-like domain-containing protein n=1 Tax=Leptomonas seymouri TaxID=5684 RepID=A0A0N0P2Z7_LEPSE|nr:hypothetical protein ABL78_7909 [Leptomonas seymouri]|eukprot:KPI83067.1 hypothetical protein ABL78_7909 [Leptomonas seymouri]